MDWKFGLTCFFSGFAISWFFNWLGKDKANFAQREILVVLAALLVLTSAMLVLIQIIEMGGR